MDVDRFTTGFWRQLHNAGQQTRWSWYDNLIKINIMNMVTFYFCLFWLCVCVLDQCIFQFNNRLTSIIISEYRKLIITWLSLSPNENGFCMNMYSFSLDSSKLTIYVSLILQRKYPLQIQFFQSRNNNPLVTFTPTISKTQWSSISWCIIQNVKSVQPDSNLTNS